MRIKPGIALFIAALAMVLLLLTPEPSHAQTKRVPCGSYIGAQYYSNYAGLTNHIANCVRDTLDSATDDFFDPQTGFYPLVSRAIMAVMTLAIIIFGIMATFGMLEKPGRDSIMLLLKIAAVTFFTTNSDWMYHQVLASMDSAAQSVVSFSPITGNADNTGKGFDQVECFKNMQDVQNNVDPRTTLSGPWLAMDCMIDSVIGIKVNSQYGITKGGL